MVVVERGWRGFGFGGVSCAATAATAATDFPLLPTSAIVRVGDVVDCSGGGSFGVVSV